MAAGGLVWRREDNAASVAAPASDSLRLVLVHRPRYGDWSLPKGKSEQGESAEDTARREVAEETGLRCRLGRELVTVRYRTPRGEDKTVRWWEMTVESDDGFEPNDEVDELRWVDLSTFDTLADLETDRAVVDSFLAGRAV